MKAILIGAIIFIISAWPTGARLATVRERVGLSVTIASYLHNRDYGKSNPFETGAVAVGAAVVESHFALADWKSADGKEKGQVDFFYACDSWNVGKVTKAQFRVQDLTGRRLGEVTREDAAKMIAELKWAERQGVGYLRPAKPTTTC
jgi:hypothetical protein